jgi:hypothetical protein
MKKILSARKQVTFFYLNFRAQAGQIEKSFYYQAAQILYSVVDSTAANR